MRVEYMVLHAGGPEGQKFEDQIAKYRSEGWVYAGPFTVVPDGPGNVVFFQPMEKVIEEETTNAPRKTGVQPGFYND